MHDMNEKAAHPIVRNRESLVTPSETPIFSDAEKTNCSQLWNQIMLTKPQKQLILENYEFSPNKNFN